MIVLEHLDHVALLVSHVGAPSGSIAAAPPYPARRGLYANPGSRCRCADRWTGVPWRRGDERVGDRAGREHVDRVLRDVAAAIAARSLPRSGGAIRHRGA